MVVALAAAGAIPGGVGGAGTVGQAGAGAPAAGEASQGSAGRGIKGPGKENNKQAQETTSKIEDATKETVAASAESVKDQTNNSAATLRATAAANQGQPSQAQQPSLAAQQTTGAGVRTVL